VIKTSPSSDVKLLFSPTKRDPLAALEVAKRLTPLATESELLDMLEKHLHANTIAMLKLNNNTSLSLREKIRLVISTENESFDLNNINLRNMGRKNFNESPLRTQMFATADTQSQNALNPCVSEIDKLAGIVKQLVELQLNRVNVQTDKRDVIVNGQCYFHNKFAETAMRCKPGCRLYGDGSKWAGNRRKREDNLRNMIPQNQNNNWYQGGPANPVFNNQNTAWHQSTLPNPVPVNPNANWCPSNVQNPALCNVNTNWHMNNQQNPQFNPNFSNPNWNLQPNVIGYNWNPQSMTPYWTNAPGNIPDSGTTSKNNDPNPSSKN
jgi:hypothetical protein